MRLFLLPVYHNHCEMMLVQGSVKKTCPTCEVVEEAEEDVCTIKLMWFAEPDVKPGNTVWNSAIPVVDDVMAPRRNEVP